MAYALEAAVGIVIALVGMFPVAWVLKLGLRHDERATVARGLAGVLISFIMSSALLFMAFQLFGAAFRVCGIAFAIALVVILSVASVRAHLMR